MKAPLAVLLCLAGSARPVVAAAQAPAPRLITVDDLFGIREVHDPQISPDGQFIAYTVSSTSLKEDKRQTRVWMVATAGGEAVALTSEEVSSDHPRWSPDGKFLAFLSERKGTNGSAGKTQVYLLNRQGGEAQRLTNTVQDVEDFAWSPKGKRLVLILRDPSREELEAAANKAKEREEDGADKPAAKKDKAQRPWVIDRLYFKEDTIGYLDRRRKHLYVFDLGSKGMTEVSSGDYDDTAPAWSPDGKQLAFSSNRSKPDPDATYASNIWVVSADNTDRGASPIQVTMGLGGDHDPAWSPDGKWIAYSSRLDPKLFEYATSHIAVSPASGGPAKVLTLELDRNATEPRFAPDGRGVYFIVDDDGTQNLALANLSDGKIARPVSGRVMLEGFSVSNEGTLAVNVSTMERPYELYTVRGPLTRLSHLNDGWLAQLKLSAGEYVSFKSKDGTTVHGYVYKPTDYTPGKKYPTIVRPHGGPVWAYYAGFQDLAQLFAANGYVVLLPNPRGSSGYGQDYCKAIYADWGNKDYQDDMAMVDYAIAEGVADPDKLGVGGWSYGGISTDFIIGQTNRFKAAISGAGAAEFTSLWGHDEYVRDYITELGLPWEQRGAWDRVAPFWHIKDILTPTMFVGGNVDWNVPILGGEQMYQSLKALGRDTLLVVYPDEYHEFKTPSHIRDLDERYLAWYAHYVKADGTPARPAEKSAADWRNTKVPE
jgi:dipeptidyl aminopeptidase/acylaminoacyl peptidase